VHTSAKAVLTSVAIRVRVRIRIHIRIRDPNRYQNLIICSLAHCQPSLTISCKSVRTFLRKVASKQTDKQRRLHILIGGGNNDNMLSLKRSCSLINFFYLTQSVARSLCNRHLSPYSLFAGRPVRSFRAHSDPVVDRYRCEIGLGLRHDNIACANQSIMDNRTRRDAMR